MILMDALSFAEAGEQFAVLVFKLEDLGVSGDLHLL